MSITTAPAGRGPPNISEIDRICRRALQGKWATGMACLLAAPRGSGLAQLIHVGTLGRTAAEGGRPITKDTLFDLGTLTETVATANVALMLAAQGRISLTSTLGQCLPAAARGPLADRTLGALLDHSAGLPPGDAALTAQLALLPPPERPRVATGKEQLARVTTKVPLTAQGVPTGAGPLDAAALTRLRAALCATQPVRAQGEVAAHTPLGPLLVGWAMESRMNLPLDVLLRDQVVAPLLPKGALGFRRNGPLGPLQPTQEVATSLVCPWRHRPLVGEAQDRLAWALGGVAGHSGAFATGDGLMRMALGLLFSITGVVRYAHGGTLQRFWSRPSRAIESPYTPGWMVPCRLNGMAQSRWHGRTVGQVDASGSALFIDPAFGLLGVLLINGARDTPEAQAALQDIRVRVFDAMASYGQNLGAGSAR